MADWPISTELRSYLEVQYELLRPLGSGGMGAVLLARERALERMVAIKVLHPSSASDAESRERFRREARTAARLTHPNIVPLYTFGDVGGELYFVMGFVDGETLAARLAREGRLSVEDATRLLGEIADALDYAHRAGTVHRDLKPENILLEATTGRALLTDFGIARDIDPASGLTSTGVIVGTPHYMSPEQASGERAIDGRSDIYALGVIGYRLVSGTLPLGGENAREVIARHLSAEAAPLPVAVRDAAPGYVAAIARAMAKEPAARWQSAGEFAMALRSTTGDEVLGDELEQRDAIVANSVLIVSAMTVLFPLASLVGITDDPLLASVATWSAATLLAAGAGVMGAKLSTLGGDPATRDLRWRVSLRPPKWWPLWWPRRFRRPGDVWERLPPELRWSSWVNALATAVLVPVQVGALLWVFSPIGSATLGQWLIGDRSVINVALGIGIALAATPIAAIVAFAHRFRKRTKTDLHLQRLLFSLSPSDPRWAQPRFAAFLDRGRAQPAAVLAKSTDELVRELRGAGVVLPDGMTEARSAAREAAVRLDRELQALREMVNAEEIQRLDDRLRALGTGDASLRDMLESQRALLAKAEARIAELGALRNRLDAQQALLHQQLIALREIAPSGAAQSEITGKLRRVNDDLRRLADGYGTLS